MLEEIIVGFLVMNSLNSILLLGLRAYYNSTKLRPNKCEVHVFEEHPREGSMQYLVFQVLRGLVAW
ncbi:MAG: hypothetical protein LM557_04930 [Desulfurococcaceae archaeon]|nr:hypothetical protein [Desulfurococcaceae archaeon]